MFPGEGPSELAVKTWREAYAGHYHDNLAVAHLQDVWAPNPLDDGDTDNIDEHGDDDDSNE